MKSFLRVTSWQQYQSKKSHALFHSPSATPSQTSLHQIKPNNWCSWKPLFLWLFARLFVVVSFPSPCHYTAAQDGMRNPVWVTLSPSPERTGLGDCPEHDTSAAAPSRDQRGDSTARTLHWALQSFKPVVLVESGRNKLKAAQYCPWQIPKIPKENSPGFLWQPGCCSCCVRETTAGSNWADLLFWYVFR